MKISVDAGGLGAKENQRFGNYFFSENLIKALLKYDKKNQYYFYTFDKLKPRFGWLKIRLSIEELKEKKDVFLALNQAIPFYVSGKIISFCHGLAYYFYPQFYTFKDNFRLRNQLDEMIIRSDIIVVSSVKVKKEIEKITFKYLKKPKIVVLPFGVAFDMIDNLKKRINNSKTKQKYFLFVAMNHPIKNIEFIKKVFNEFKKIKKYKNYQLKLITNGASRKKLKKLYQNAAALLTASYYESFNLPVLEALVNQTPVIGLKSAIIPELRPYVNLAKDKDDFINLMKTIPKKPNKTTVKLLIKKFNWKNYIEKLIKLYK